MQTLLPRRASFLGSALLAVAASLALGGTALATPITLSVVSSDETPASVLDATFDFSAVGSVLTLTVTNDTTAPNAFNVNQVYFNAAASVTSLTLTSATHSINGDVTASWLPVVTNTLVDGFGVFDFGVQNGVGETAPSTIQPAASIAFTFAITGTGPFTDLDFIQQNAAGFTAAAKFVNGPGDDSAFGAVPEPSTAVLLGGGLLALAARRSRARRDA